MSNYMDDISGPSRPRQHGPVGKHHPPPRDMSAQPMKGNGNKRMPNVRDDLTSDFYRLYTPGPYSRRGKA